MDAPMPAIKELEQIKGMQPAIARILAQRGISNYADASAFFNPDLDGLHDPFLMKDMRAATQRILDARKKGERILVYGDYDVDGTTSVACMYSFLLAQQIGSTVDFYVPNRHKEGYGISNAGIEFARENQYSLVIALDCGIKSVDLIRKASSHGIDFIVCDHHLPGQELPPALAILNPKQAQCPYPFKELCGCGVGFKLISALAAELGLDKSYPYQYLDLVATAIAADIVPMTGENRVMVFHGLAKVNQKPSLGIRAILEASGFQKKLTIQDLVFLIAPRINAAGRMDDARKVIRLFMETDEKEALKIARDLQLDNTDRKKADSEATEQALSMIRADQAMLQGNATVVYHPQWHKGVIGIVASRLIEQFYRPTIVLTNSGGVVSGSARSIPGFNLHDGLDACADLLLGYGGHYFAAGMTLEASQVKAFRDRFERIVRERLPEDMMFPEILVHAELDFSGITEKFFRQLKRLEPFGPENPEPVFLTRGATMVGKSRIAKEKHLQFSMSRDGKIFKCFGFNLAQKQSLLDGGPVHMVYTIDENEWNGSRSLQLKVLDLKAADATAIGPFR